MPRRPDAGETVGCRECSEPFTVGKARDGVCPRCRYKSQKTRCPDCGAPCHPRAQRCNACANRERASGNVGNVTVHGPSGYRLVKMPDHPNARKDGYVREHVLVASQTLGRPLTADEVVHHVNHDRLDNHPGNLRVMSKAEHRALHDAERNPRLAAFDPLAAATSYREGRTSTEIAAEWGVSVRFLLRNLRAQGVEIRPTGRRSRAD